MWSLSGNLSLFCGRVTLGISQFTTSLQLSNPREWKSHIPDGNISNFFIIIFLRWSVTIDLWRYCCNCLGHHKPPLHKTVNLLDQSMCSDCSTNHSLISFPLLRPLYSLRHNSIDIRPMNNPTMTSKCSCERKSHVFLTLTQKLDMIELGEEGTSKAKIGQKLGLLFQTGSWVVNAEAKLLKKIPVF